MWISCSHNAIVVNSRTTSAWNSTAVLWIRIRLTRMSISYFRRVIGEPVSLVCQATKIIRHSVRIIPAACTSADNKVNQLMIESSATKSETCLTERIFIGKARRILIFKIRVLCLMAFALSISTVIWKTPVLYLRDFLSMKIQLCAKVRIFNCKSKRKKRSGMSMDWVKSYFTPQIIIDKRLRGITSKLKIQISYYIH